MIFNNVPLQEMVYATRRAIRGGRVIRLTTYGGNCRRLADLRLSLDEQSIIWYPARTDETDDLDYREHDSGYPVIDGLRFGDEKYKQLLEQVFEFVEQPVRTYKAQVNGVWIDRPFTY